METLYLKGEALNCNSKKENYFHKGLMDVQNLRRLQPPKKSINITGHLNTLLTME